MINTNKFNIELKKSEDERWIIKDIETLAKSSGFVHVISYLSWHDNFINISDEVLSDNFEKMHNPSRTIRNELMLLMGLIVKQQIISDNATESEFESLLDNALQLLDKLHKSLGAELINNMLIEHSKELNFENVRSSLKEPIFYAGESAYNFQLTELAKKKYENDENWFAENLSVSISQIVEIAQALEMLQSQKLNRLIAREGNKFENAKAATESSTLFNFLK